MKTIFARFAKDESGATAIEYGLIAGLVAVVIITAVGLVGTDLKGIFDYIATKLTVPTA
jgi:pilus assembly protein Flp/PilA